MTTRKYTERRLYFFTCSKCDRVNAQSYKRRKVKQGLCRKCLRLAKLISKGQEVLFVSKSLDNVV